MPSLLARLRYSPFVANVIVTRRCNLSCGYCNEFDRTSEPVAAELLDERLTRLRQLGTFGVSLSGGEPTLHPELPRDRSALPAARLSAHGDDLQRPLAQAGAHRRAQRGRAAGAANLHRRRERQRDHPEGAERPCATRLDWLRQHARFHVTVSGVIGACPPAEVAAVVDHAQKLGFSPRVLLVHDERGRVRLSAEERQLFDEITRSIPRTWMDFGDYRAALIRDGRAPFKCRAGSRYLYVDEEGLVSWCSQTRATWSKPLADYTVEDLRAQFHTPKPCQDACTLGCVRSASQLDRWRAQARS